MLVQLVIRDLGLMEHAELEFGPGLQVITGETGVGKTLLIATLALLRGDRARADLIRSGAEEGRVAGFLVVGAERVGELEAASGLEFPGGELRIERRLRRTGRSQALVNGQEVPLAQLQRLGELLIEIQGQRAQLGLLDPARQLEALDRYAGLDAQRDGFGAAYQEARALAARIETSSSHQRERADRCRFLEHVLGDLDKAALVPGEREEVERDLRLLEEADHIRLQVQQAVEELYEGEPNATDTVARHQGAFESLAELHPALAEVTAACAAASVALEEAVRALRVVQDGLDQDPARLEELRARYQELVRLEERYHRGAAELIEYREAVRAELGELATGDAELPALENELRARLAALGEAARTLGQARRAAAARLARALVAELPDLGLPNATLQAQVERLALPAGGGAAGGATGGAWHGLGPTGADRVEFRFGPNPGEAPRPLAEIASGGELSRIMLSLQRVLAGAHRVPVLVFDEIDAGVGARLGTELGRKLRQIGAAHQVLCVTHLPQIASAAARHLHASKRVADGRTVTGFEVLDEERRVDEIAAMIRGAGRTATSHAEAREMLAEAAAGAEAEAAAADRPTSRPTRPGRRAASSPPAGARGSAAGRKRG